MKTHLRAYITSVADTYQYLCKDPFRFDKKPGYKNYVRSCIKNRKKNKRKRKKH